MPDPSILTVDDFQLHVGNSADPATWDVAPPATLTVLEGAGVDGSDRLVLTWADQSITHTWLQVRMLANTNTNLDVDDVFYFGNAVGEVGNAARVAGASGNNADVNIFDISGAWSHLHGSDTADITDPYDINKDGAVNIFDISAMWSNLRGGNGALQLGTVDPGDSNLAVNLAGGSLAPGSLTPGGLTLQPVNTVDDIQSLTVPTTIIPATRQQALSSVQTLAMALASSRPISQNSTNASTNTSDAQEENTNRVRLLIVEE
jgi:hypothetical protein